MDANGGNLSIESGSGNPTVRSMNSDLGAFFCSKNTSTISNIHSEAVT